MGGRRTWGVIAAVFACVLTIPSTALAADPLTCFDDPAPATTNQWIGGDGAWSEASNWSLGHRPTSDEVACVLDDLDQPVVDVDIDVAGLLIDGVFTVPSGRTVTTRGLLLDGPSTFASNTELHLIGPSVPMSGNFVHIGGTLRITGDVDLGSLNVQGLPGASPTIAAHGRVDLSFGSDRGLRLAAGTELHGDVSVSGDVIVEPGASISGTVLVSPAPAGHSALVGDFGPESIIAIRGDTTVDSRGATVMGASIEGAELVIDNGTLRAQLVGIGEDGTIQVTNDGVLDAAYVRMDGDGWLDLASCAPRPPTDTSITVLHATIADLDCIDPATGSTTELDIEGGSWDHPAATIPGGALDGGGTLRLAGNLGFPAGATLVDGATQLIAVGEFWNIVGAGTFTMVDLDLATESGGVMHAGNGQVWRFISPSDRTGTGMLVATSGDGLLEIHDAQRRSTHLFALPDMTRATYYANGVPYVPGQADPVPPTVTPPVEPAPPTPRTPEPTDPAPTRVVRSGNAGPNRLTGGPLADRLFGMGGSDILRGGAGNDRIDCGTGLRDQAFGGAGNDHITCRDRGRGRDVVDCGPGRDRAVVDRFDVVRGCEIVVRR